MVEIECHLCGKNFSFPQCIDTAKYDGEVICPECNSLLHIKLVKGKLQKREFVKKQPKLLTMKRLAELDAEAEQIVRQKEKGEQDNK